LREIRAQLIRYAPGYRMDDHSDGCHRLSILVAGDLAESDRTRTEIAGVGSVGLKASSFVHRTRFGSGGATIVSVRLPGAALESLSGRSPLPPWMWRHGCAARLLGLRLAAALRRDEGGEAEECVRALLGRVAARPEPATPSPRLERVRRRLESEPARASVDALAEEARMHPVSLGRAFRRRYGCSLTTYRQRLRVAAVARELLAGPRTLVEIAQDHDFADLSHLTRVFRRELGVPPGAFRRALRVPEPGLDSFNTEWRLSA
jgi:AraC-like DNA-binding protein